MKKLSRRKIGWIVAVVIMVGLGIWVQSRWDAWFRNPAEEPCEPFSVPSHVLLTFGDSDEQSRNISWQCDSIVLPSYLELACLADSDTMRVEAVGEVFCSRTGQKAYYVARLRQLKADTHYAYRAVTDGRCSEWYQFRTYPDGRNHFSFMYVGDVQDTISGEAHRFLCEALQRHSEAEFVVCGGDLIDRPTNQDWGETFRGIDSIAQSMPFMTVTGNHDYLKGVVVQLERRFPLVFSYFLDSMVGDNQVFTFCYGPAQFFFLDSNREFPYLYRQRQWLEEQLKKSTARWKILVLHHPLFSIKGNSNNLIQRWMFNGLVEDYGVDLVMQGHEHAYGRMTAKTDDNHAVTPVYTVSHCSPKNYRISFDDRFDKFGISSRYYQTVSVSGDTLSLAAYEVYGHTLYDSLCIVKSAGVGPVIEDFGACIPENMDFTPAPDSKKDRDFAARIADYKLRHPERMRK